MTDRVVEVLGLPEDVDDELLSLYFENKRRSGGGPLVSVEKTEDRALLVFEEAEAAVRVLSKEHHVVHNVELSVRKPASKDPYRFLLKGINPSTSIEMIELYVENLLNLSDPEYTLHPAPDNKLILIQLSQPLAQDFQRLSDRISKRPLSGAVVTLEEVMETDAVLVENVHPGTTADLISLYFESQRGGGQRVKEVLMMSEGSAKVIFVCFESVGLILNIPHKLEGAELLIKPYFDFLQPQEAPSLPLPDSVPSLPNTHQTDLYIAPDQPDLYMAPDPPSMEQEETPMQIIPISPVVANADSLSPPILIPRSVEAVEVMEETQPEEVQITTETLAVTDLTKLSLFQKSALPQNPLKSLSGYDISVNNNGVHITGPAGTEMDQIKSTIMRFFSSLAETTFTLEQAQAQFLAQREVKERMEQMIDPFVTLYTVSDCTVVVMSLSEDSAKQACDILKAHLSSFSLQVDPDNESMLYCREWQEFCRALGFVQVSERGRSLEVVTLKGMEREKQSAILTFLTTPIEREMFIAMEPGRLKYIQTHSHQLLADMTEVSIFPVEDSDVCGLKIHGHPTACQIAEELLQGLVSDICTRTITVNAPGVTRFMETDECKKMFHDMETKFHVCIFPELVPWEPPVNKNIFECAWKLIADKNFSTQNTPDGPHHTAANTTLLNEAKKIVSAIEEKPPEPLDVVDTPEDMENIDLYSAEEPTVTSGLQKEDNLAFETTGSENPMTERASGLSSNLEEEAQLSLAIQYSMESNSWPMDDEDAQLQKALELSRKQIQEEVISHQGTQNMEEPAKRLLEDTIQSANTLKLVVFANYTSDLIRVDIAFGKKVNLRQDEQKLEDRCLKSVSDFHKMCLNVIRRNHAVKIDIVGTIISVSGFKAYVDEAMPNVKILLEKMSDSVSDKEILRTVQWFQHGPAAHQKTPYPPELTILLDNARRMRLRTLDILLDNQLHKISIEKMEVQNQISGAVLKITRENKQGDNVQEDAPEEDYSILSNLPEATKVDENSDEFQIVVKNFYETIHHYHSRIRIIKVEKLMNTLLYSQYKLKKASVMQNAVYPQVERTLYHGTSEGSVKEICVHGFNRSFCGKNATVYGQGVYFAVNSSLSMSDQYSPPNVDGHKYIFVAKVLTGDYTLGNHSMKTAPLRETGDIPLRYDSVTDDITKPTLFVIFNDTQAFPQYLITCQHIYGH